jgi:CRISPR-associated protein Csy1
LSKSSHDTLVNQARESLVRGDYRSAITQLERVVRGAAPSASTLHLLAHAYAKERRYESAVSTIERAIAMSPGDPALHLTLANLEQDRGQPERAIAALRRAISLQPNFPEALNNLGILLVDANDPEGAHEAFLRAVEQKPRYARALANLASVRIRLKLSDGAAAAALQATKIEPGNVHAWHALGQAQMLRGQPAEAEEALGRALSLDPRHTVSAVLLGRLLSNQRRLDELFEHARRTIATCIPSGDSWMMFAEACMHQEDMDAAREAYVRARQFTGYEGAAFIREKLMLPSIYLDRDDIQRWRSQMDAGLDEIAGNLPRWLHDTSRDVIVRTLGPNFLLPYQGEVDVILQRKTSAVVHAVLDHSGSHPLPPSRQARIGRRMRVGFCSRFFYKSTVGNYFISWLEAFGRAQHEVYVFSVHPGRDELTERAIAAADHYWQGDTDHVTAAKAIAASGLDVLIYPEIGMDACVFLLAHLRLAPIQICAWGHPVTTGIETIDHYISCAEMEPADAPSHYTENLHLLPGIGTSYPMPSAPQSAKQRSDFQLPEHAILVLFPQSLFKIHPDNDDVIVKFLGANPEAVLVMFAGQSSGVSRKFSDRLLNAFHRHGVSPIGRIKILPPLSHDDYKRLNALCDLMLDCLHWSGGNTTLDALATGLPVVTLPGRLMRGRQSMAMLKAIGLDELIASDEAHFCELASRLVRDAQWRQSLRERILARRQSLFDDPRPVTVLVDTVTRLHLSLAAPPAADSDRSSSISDAADAD